MKTYMQKHKNIKYSDNWSTPEEIYKEYITDKEYYDPCPLYDDSFDVNNTIIDCDMFINPPYSNVSEWVDFAIRSHKNNHIVILIPSRTDTKYFHKLLEHGVDLEFVKGRLKFGGVKTGAPFPSVLVHLCKNL